MEQRSYKDTLLLPSPEFSIQGVKDEAALLKDFKYETGDPASYKLVLHDGPPYANGNIHMGHAMNKILKDFIVRHHRNQGAATSFVPGWDCHGLPIEWQIERDLIAEGRSKADFTPVEFRALCRDYARKWVDIQREQFKSLGVIADWDNPYLTMDFRSEGQIVRALHDHVLNEELYMASRPVMWSIVEETALAEAEIDKKDIKTTSVFVRFPVDSYNLNASVVIWTTTPWTIPANRAVAYNPKIEYAIFEVTEVDSDSHCKVGDRLIMATKLATEVMEKLSVVRYFETQKCDPRYLMCGHPLRGEDGYHFSVPLIMGDFVTDDTGTGFVHIAPEHGPEDFECYRTAFPSEEIPNTVGSDGAYADDVPLFAGKKVLRQTGPGGDYIFEFTNGEIVKALMNNNTFLGGEKVLVNYPHSWRSKAPLIYRATNQWFVRITGEQYRYDGDALVIPAEAETRLRDAINQRPDWLISRQRLWGTPLAVVLYKETKELITNECLLKAIADIITEEGGDAWWTRDLTYFFERAGLDWNPEFFEKVTDVLDVWFDSGNSYRLVPDTAMDNVVGVEGSDQARGWFGSAYIEHASMGRVHPLFGSIYMHGFVLDHNGKKMSKSEGNVVDPLVEAATYGTDVIRLWVALSDPTQDVRVGPQILKTTSEQYKKLRNAMRFLVGNLKGEWTAADAGDHTHGPLERRMFVLMEELDNRVSVDFEECKFNTATKALLDFCVNDLSAFYFDIRKDSLYCDRPDSPRRRSVRAVMAHLFDLLARYMGVILPFTVAEARQELGRDFFYEAGQRPTFHEDHMRWADIEQTIQMVNAFMETARKEKRIGSGMDAHVILTLTDEQQEAFRDLDVEDIFRVSQVTFKTGPADVEIVPAKGQKCARSRKITLDVGSDPRYPDLSARDADAVAYWDSLHA